MLKAHLARIAVLQQRLQPLLEAQRKRDALRSEELRLVGELDKITEAEKADWAAFTRDGAQGDPPRPRTQERNLAVMALRTASEARLACDATAGGGLEAAVADLNRQLASLATETAVRVDAVLRELADTLVDRYAAQLHATIMTESCLLALRDAAQARGNGTLLTTINGWLKRGKDDAHLHDGVRETRARWRALADRLAENPDAEEPTP
ncbi:MAG TPA: hypothetical protein VET84_03315 [Stellaceae bacterium]|nr:hypothetical protein [Stellaceae bacterium]